MDGGDKMSNKGRIVIPLSDRLHRWDDEVDDLKIRCPLCSEWVPMHHTHVVALHDEFLAMHDEFQSPEVVLEFV